MFLRSVLQIRVYMGIQYIECLIFDSIRLAFGNVLISEGTRDHSWWVQ